MLKENLLAARVPVPSSTRMNTVVLVLLTVVIPVLLILMPLLSTMPVLKPIVTLMTIPPVSSCVLLMHTLSLSVNINYCLNLYRIKTKKKTSNSGTI